MAFGPLMIFSMLVHAWVGWRLIPSVDALWPMHPYLGPTLVLVFFASAVLMPLGMWGRRMKRRPLFSVRLGTVIQWAGLLFMGLFSTLFVLTFVRDVLLVFALIAHSIAPQAVPIDMLRHYSAAAVLVLGLLVSAWGFLNARRTAAIVKVDVPIRNLPAALQGFTVAQISDIHVGPTIKQKYLRRIVDKVNGLQADMVAITGDLVDGRVSELAAQVAPLRQLQSTHGTYFVTGNHEYYSGAHEWVKELRRLGVQVLMNEHVVLMHAYTGTQAKAGEPVVAPIVIAGVADYGAHHFDESHRSDPARALRGAPDGVVMRMLLAHQPRSAEAAAEAGYQLQLSGHTHGGQFWPWNLFVRFQQPFTAGLHKLKDLWVYTSRGTGYWGPPKRFGAPSEITHLRLVAA